MAAQPHAFSREADFETLGTALPGGPAEHPLTKLRVMHDEAEETSRLANLLGRARYVGLLLPVLLFAAVVLSPAPSARAGGFCVLVLLAAGALLYTHRKAMHAPFDRAPLKAFSADLDAILLYAGFAWGAGAFLVLPANTDPAYTAFFSGGTAAVIAMIVRKREAVLMFAAPAGLLTALAAQSKPLELPFVSAALAIAACAFVVGSVALSSWMKERAVENVARTDVQPA
jgi:hypothetical protein